MRFVTLDLRNYGPFQHAPVLDLSNGDRGLHLIVGPNEAGKSTALRAIRALLFDYPLTTPDSHGRDLGVLRVGATLRDEAGGEIAFLRRKRGNRLWSLDDRTALPSEALAPFLGQLDEATFETLFSTDHAELVTGGRGIITGKGRLGEMLFSAGTGLAQLDRVQKALQSEIEGLFKTRNATIPTINKTLIELKAARDEVKQVALPTQDWVNVNTDWNQNVAARAEVSRRKHEAQAELDRWRGWLGALRIIPRRQSLLDRLHARSTTNVLRPGFAGAYQTDLEASRLAASTVRDARSAIEAASIELDQIGPLDPALLAADAIGRLHADLGRYASARRDRPDLVVQLGRSEEQIRAVEDELPANLAIPTGGVGPLREAIGKLAREHASLMGRQEEAKADLARFDTAGLDPLGDEAILPDTVRWVASLDEVLTRVAAPGQLEAQRLKAAGKLATATEQAASALRGLMLWSGTLDDLEALAIPPDATFDHAEMEIRAADERVRAAEADRTRLEADQLELARQAEHARVGGAIPTEAELDQFRSHRDAVWQSIRRTWINHDPIAPSPDQLADDFETDIRAADNLADALRREASRVAAAAQGEIDRRDIVARLDLASATRDGAIADRATAFDRWAAHWRPLGIEPLSPREMKDWVRIERKERLRCAKAVRDARGEVARLTEQIAELRAELGSALGRVGEAVAADGESLAALLARGRDVVARIGARRQRQIARGRLDEVRALEADWLDRWGRAVAPLGLSADDSVSAAEAVLEQFAAWSEATRQARTTRDQLADLTAIEQRFAAEARGLASRLDAGLLGDDEGNDESDWQPVAAALVDRLARAGEARTRRSGCLARLDEEQGRLTVGQAALARADDALAALAQEAGCLAVDELPAAIRASAEVEKELASLQAFDEQLDNHAGSLTRAGLLEAVAGLDDVALAVRIADAEERLANLEAQSHRLGEQIGAARQKLDAMDNRLGAFEAGQVVEGHVARLGVEVEKYARLKLAAALLRDAVERYRARHQGPVLDQAGRLFARMTNGAFVGLQTDQDEKGDPILRGVRGNASVDGADPTDPATTGPLLDVAAMSEGTADQLYLALRLASLSVHLDDHEPTPLVVDDILINFDDARARAALEALGELSRRTQILFFTHHDHLAEIARSCLPADVLFTHRLTTRGPIGESTEGVITPVPAFPRSKRKRATSASSLDT